MQTPRILKPFLKLTEKERMPTDPALDHDIEYVNMVMHGVWPLLKRIIWKKTVRFFKYKWRLLVGTAVVIACISCAFIFRAEYVASVEENAKNSRPAKTDTVTHYRNDSTMNLRNFLLQIAYGESRYVKHAGTDQSQFWGLYQIGTTERRVAGYGDVPRAVFENHPEIQDLCMIEFLKYNKKYMQPYIDKYSGKIVDGILVTESGILALCMAGCGTAQKCLDAGVIPETDANGNKLRQLLKMGGYELRLEQVRYSIQDAVTGPPTIK
jgi:hypothetical protein